MYFIYPHSVIVLPGKMNVVILALAFCLPILLNSSLCPQLCLLSLRHWVHNFTPFLQNHLLPLVWFNNLHCLSAKSLLGSSPAHPCLTTVYFPYFVDIPLLLHSLIMEGKKCGAMRILLPSSGSSTASSTGPISSAVALTQRLNIPFEAFVAAIQTKKHKNTEGSINSAAGDKGRHQTEGDFGVWPWSVISTF